jgi:Tfp pilus assembly protein PilO
VFEITPKGEEQKEYYNSVFYAIKMATTFHDMGSFLAEVANFPFIVNVSKVISKTYEDLPKAPKVKEKSMITEFVLTAYTAKPSANVNVKSANPQN